MYTISKWLRGSVLVKTKIFPASFGRVLFQRNLLKF